jgi:hypothetical protein
MVDPVYARYDHPLAEELMVCSVCGAVVDWVWTDKHTEWHKNPPFLYATVGEPTND